MTMQGTDIVRRMPSQARGAATVETLFEATARILESGDNARLTTNHIAVRAGFSIGTLYGYFSDKRSLLRAMALREAERQQRQVMQMLDKAGPKCSAEDLIRIVIRAVLRPFDGRKRLRMAMMSLLLKDDDGVVAAAAAQEQVMDALLQKIASRTNSDLAERNPDSRFLVHAAVSGTIKAAVSERPDILETQAFEDHLVTLVMSCLGSGSKSNTA